MGLIAIAECDICKKEFRVELNEARRGGYYDPCINTVQIDLALTTGGYDFDFGTVCKPCRTAIKTEIAKTIAALKKGTAGTSKPKTARKGK